MRELETTFIVQPELSEEGCQAICQRLDEVFGRSGSIRLIYDDSGKRKLAYEIKNFQKGRYFCVHYFDSGKVVPEVERILRLDESVLRFLTVRVADEVKDIEARKLAAVEEEKIRTERAAERAARAAEERAEAEAEERLVAEAREAMAKSEDDENQEDDMKNPEEDDAEKNVLEEKDSSTDRSGGEQ